MLHVAIDLGSRKSQFCIRSPSGAILREGKVWNGELEQVLSSLEERSQVVVETCAEAFAVADIAKTAGHNVVVVPSTLAPSLGVGQRGVKTDKKDAQNLSLASCRMENLPAVHRPAVPTRELRSRLTARAALISARTKLINCVRGLGRGNLVRFGQVRAKGFAKHAREKLLASPCGVADYVEHLLKALEALDEQIAAADKELSEMADRDEVAVRLMTVPGVAHVTAMSFRAALDDVTRFGCASAVSSYLGLTPGENSSGTKTNRTGITRAGPNYVRGVLIQAAWSAFRCRPDDPMVQWARKLAEKKPKQVAVTALARKMSGILFALWRDGKTYDPAHQQ